MKLSTGLIGTGLWGRMHATAYRDHPGAELLAVCDLNLERARAVAEEFGIPRVYDSVEDLVADPAIDAVSVVTPDFAHLEPALAVIAAGKALLIEKPLATTVEDAIAIRDAAKAAGVIAMVDFHNRFNPQFDTARKRLTDGTLGDARYIYMRHSNTTAVPLGMLSWPEKSSSLWFLGSHSSDLVRWLVGSEPVQVYGARNYGVLRNKGLDVPDVWTYIVHFANGAIGSIENAWILPPSLPGHGDFRSEIVAEKGVYYTQLQAPEVNEMYAEDAHSRLDYMTYLDIQGARSGFTLQSIQYFVDCVLAQKQPFITLDDGVANTRILCAVEESAASGLPVTLESR